MANGYKITRSNYTVKQRHQVLTGGVVYERDFMTTTNLGSWDSGVIPYGEGNFKMSYRAKSNVRKNPYQGQWLTTDCEEGETQYFTSDCLPVNYELGENKIKINPNYNSLLDFAYYGSCTELVKSTISNIIKAFPAELYSENGSQYGFNDNIIKNNFEINLTDEILPEGENELRYFLRRFQDYVYINNSVEYAINNAELLTKDNCGNFVLKITTDSGGALGISGITYESGLHVLLTNISTGGKIRPKQDIVDKFFTELDDFGKVLLNSSTNPRYTAVLDTPFETDNGVEIYQVAYTWPEENGWNLLIDGLEFQQYIDKLLSISEFYDEYYTNNLWRMLTHDSVKAMDIAFTNPQKDEDAEDYNIGTTRLEGLFWAIGRQFDEIKRAIDNVKNTSKISYDGNNNVPDCFLPDALELNGFEVQDISNVLNLEEKTGPLFAGVTSGYDAKTANSLFLRNLKLNAKDILSKKGTKQGIEALLGCFGLISYDMWHRFPDTVKGSIDYDYTIDEYIGVVTDSYSTKSAVDEFIDVERLNMLKISYPSDSPENVSNTLEGIPCEFKYIEENGQVTKYLIPWYDNGKEYDGNLYFQQRGGWGKHNIKDISENIEFTGYSETEKYAIVVDNLEDLKNIPATRIYDGVVAYVNNVEVDLYDVSAYKSHYFILLNKDKQYLIEEADGWQNMSLNDVHDKEKIYYLEHIVENTKGNNPHIGYGQYDDGSEYIEYLKMPLYYSIINNSEENEMFVDAAYDCNGSIKYSARAFEIDGNVKDNMKCWYFNPDIENSAVKELQKNSDEITYTAVNDETVSISSSWTAFENNSKTFDFITKTLGNSADEITCDSMINLKKTVITFRVKYSIKEEFEKFLESTILPYLRQVLPSGAMFGYDVVGIDEVNVEWEDTTGVELDDVSAIVGISGNTDVYDVILNYEDDNYSDNTN